MKAQEIIAHPANEQEMNTIKAFFKALKIKFEISKKSPYNPEFVAKIQESRRQYEKGKYSSIHNEKELKNFLGLD